MLRKLIVFLSVLVAGCVSVCTDSENDKATEAFETNEKVLRAIDDVKNKRSHYALRALELSLYYQGFDPEKNMYQLDKIYDDSISVTIPYNTELVGNRKVRDAKKAFEYAELAFYLRHGRRDKFESYENVERVSYLSAMFFTNLASLYITGLGVEKDLSKQKILERSNLLISWKNYYTGKFAPYDRKYAISLLEKGIIQCPEFLRFGNDKFNKEKAALFLYLIYSGKLNPEDKDLEKAKHWKSVYDKLMAALKEKKIKNWAEENENLKKIANLETKNGRVAFRRLALNYMHKREYLGLFYNKHMFIENPNYNPELAKKILKSIGFNEKQLARFLVGVSSITITGDLSEMKKFLKEALSSSTLPNDFKESLTKSASNFEKDYKRYYSPSDEIDNFIED